MLFYTQLLDLQTLDQTSMAKVKWSDLRMELIAAEDKAQVKKCKAVGLLIEDMTLAIAAIEDEDTNKWRKVWELDKDADSDGDLASAKVPKVGSVCKGS